MRPVYVSVVVLMCIVVYTHSERTRNGVCKGCQREEYTRIKRAKYYSNPPSRFYSRSPTSYPIKGAYSFTPPPGYLIDNARQHQNVRLKVSNRPTNDGLGDEDLNNMMNFLSKQDLDKLVEFANEKERESPNYSIDSLYEKPNHIANTAEKYESKVMYHENAADLDNEKIHLFRSSTSSHEDFRPYSFEFNNPNINELKETKPFRFSALEPSALFINKNKIALNTQLEIEKNMYNKQFSNLLTHAHQKANENRDGANIFTDSNLMQEERLPKPSNLREDDFEVSYTNNVPTVVKANSESYKIENFGALPLMNYHSKLDTVDSYKVPHYTVTSPEKYQAPASSGNIPVEPAPPASTAQEQSDAHLKAIKIWTHRSKGTAYTLHDDGTLSLERPSRPKIF